MTPEAVARTGMYFEEFSVGDEFTTQGRTITDVEVTMWAMFTGETYFVTAGATAVLSNNSTLGLGAVAPLTGPKPFDFEVLGQFNFRF